MSLELTPTTGRHERPVAPSRTKRSSASAQTHQHRTSTPTRLVTGDGLGEEDEELGQGITSRNNLEDALKESRNEVEQLQERVQELDNREQCCQEEKAEMARGLSAMQGRCQEAFREQTRLEMDVEARDELLDRLKSRSAMLERELREAQRIAHVQERAFEAERTALQASEAHLNFRIRQLQTTTKVKAPSSSPSETLQEDLNSLRTSHSTLLSQLDRLSIEVQELRGDTVRLKEENEGWEYLVREQTFSNRLFQRERDRETGMDGEEEGYGRRQLDVLDEGMDDEMDHLHSEMKAHSPIEDIFPRSTPTSRNPSRTMGRNISGPSMYSDQGLHTGMGSRSISGISSMYTEEPVEGMDLAAELGRAMEPVPSTTGTSADVEVGVKGETGDVEKENKRLREEVKALQLYCSKIIDRIIAQDGFEHILNVDYKTKRVGRSNVGNKDRGSLLDVVKMMQGDPTSVPSASTKEAESTIARPVSMARGNSEHAEPPKPLEEDKTTKRARRGFSLDLRTFGFGSPTSTSASTSITDKHLEPLQLAPSPAMSSMSSNCPRTTPKLPARKLEPQAEDEDDRRERSRLEAALKLMGIDKSSHPPPSPSLIDPDADRDVMPTARQNAKRSSSLKFGTPLSRLSSALGFSEPLPPDPDPSPEKVDAALKDYDVKEQARRLSLSTGKTEAGYTSPPRVTRRITDVDAVKRKVVTEGSVPRIGSERGTRRSGSISTLWSVNDTPSPDRR